MAWSRRGFPFGALAAQWIVRRRGLRCAVVFHEPVCQVSGRRVDRWRGRCQAWIIRRLYERADKAIFPDPLDRIHWLPKGASKAAFIPIGANIPAEPAGNAALHDRNGNVKTVAVFCLSDEPNRRRELADIAHAMRFVGQQGLRARVVFLGRGTAEAKEEIERMFDTTAGEALNLGLQSPDEIWRILMESDAMLCVRGPLYMRRGSAIAGLACGLPIIGYAGQAEGTPLEEAGIELVPYLDREALGKALNRVLADGQFRKELRERSSRAYEKRFAWDAIARKFAEAFDEAQSPP